MVSKRTVASWIAPVARIGLVAKGIVYFLIGIMTFMAAFHIAGLSNSNTNKRGVFEWVQQFPAGKILLAIITIGLICYCFWRGIQTFADTEKKGNNIKGISSRIRYLSSGVVYASFAFLAAKVLLNAEKGSGGNNNEWIEELLNKPAGDVLVGVAAAILAGVGFYQAYYGLSGKYREHVDTLALHRTASTSLLRAGTIGYVARGIVWLIIAYLVLKAAINHNSNEAGDTTKAFGFLQSGDYGSYLLAGLGIGLILYGFFNFIRARYERFQ